MDKFKDIVGEIVATPFCYGKWSRRFFCKAEIGDLHDHLEYHGEGCLYARAVNSVEEDRV